MKLKENGLIAQLVTLWGIFPLYQAKTICSTFWIIVFNLVLTTAVGGLIAYGLGHAIAGFAALAITGVWNFPAALVTMASALSALLYTVVVLLGKIFNSRPLGELGDFIRASYTSHKEKHCVFVRFE